MRAKCAHATSPTCVASDGGKTRRLFASTGVAGGGGARRLRRVTEGVSPCVGIADLRAAQLEAAAEVIRIGDDEVLHLAEGAVVAEEASLEFFCVGRRGHLHERGVLRGVATGAPGLAPDGVVEAAFGVGEELEERLEF